MSRLESLPPDQRAVLQLLLQKDRSYDEIAQLLRLDAGAVRDRAHAAVAAVAPVADELSDDQRGELTDHLLGEQTASARQATRAYLEGSPAARGWAREAAEELRPLAGDRLPEIPDEPTAAVPPPAPEPELDPEPAAVVPPSPFEAPDREHEPTAAAPSPSDERSEPIEDPFRAVGAPSQGVEPPRSRASRVGGMLLLFGMAAAIALLVILLLRGLGGDDEPSTPASTPPAVQSTSSQASTTPSGETTTSTTSTTPSVDAQIQLAAASGERTPRATATLLQQDGREGIAIAGTGLQPTTDRAFYGLWFVNSRNDALFLGYGPRVTDDKRLRLFDSLPEGADPKVYQELWITREVVTSSDQAAPTEPGRRVLSGDLP